ncbi:MAG: hypothetical protein K8J09_17370 [Planctomycetes bacterium]|nr:hypothetical protein [Planctomycetota bacterium]
MISIVGVRACHRGDLITPTTERFLLAEVLALVAGGIGASCCSLVVDDLAALLLQRPTPAWWSAFSEAAEACAEDGVRVLLLASPDDLRPWPAGLPQPSWTRCGREWWLGSRFGLTTEVLR